MTAEGLLHQSLTDLILRGFYDVGREMGSGFVESVYGGALACSLTELGLVVERQVPIEVFFHGNRVGLFKADMIVESKVVLELKAAPRIERIFEAQLLNYLRATKYEVGLLLNFGAPPAFKRFVFTNDRKVRGSSSHHRDVETQGHNEAAEST
jgi:GxxExxY protein